MIHEVKVFDGNGNLKEVITTFSEETGRPKSRKKKLKEAGLDNEGNKILENGKGEIKNAEH